MADPGSTVGARKRPRWRGKSRGRRPPRCGQAFDVFARRAAATPSGPGATRGRHAAGIAWMVATAGDALERWRALAALLGGARGRAAAATRPACRPGWQKILHGAASSTGLAPPTGPPRPASATTSTRDAFPDPGAGSRPRREAQAPFCHPAHGLRRLHAAPAGRHGARGAGQVSRAARVGLSAPSGHGRPGATQPPSGAGQPAARHGAPTPDARRPACLRHPPRRGRRPGLGALMRFSPRPGPAGARPGGADGAGHGLARRLRRARQRPPPGRLARGRPARPRRAPGGGAGGRATTPGTATPRKGFRKVVNEVEVGLVDGGRPRDEYGAERWRLGDAALAAARPPATAGDPPELERVALRAELRRTAGGGGAVAQGGRRVDARRPRAHPAADRRGARLRARHRGLPEGARHAGSCSSYARPEELLRRAAGHPAPAAREAGRADAGRPGRPRRARNADEILETTPDR